MPNFVDSFIKINQSDVSEAILNRSVLRCGPCDPAEGSQQPRSHKAQAGSRIYLLIQPVTLSTNQTATPYYATGPVRQVSLPKPTLLDTFMYIYCKAGAKRLTTLFSTIITITSLNSPLWIWAMPAILCLRFSPKSTRLTESQRKWASICIRLSSMGI